jgi:hypothetical protein
MKKNELKENNSFFGGFEAVVDGLSRPGGVSKSGSSKNPDDDSFETVTEIGDKEKEYPLIDPTTGREMDESELETNNEDEDGLQKGEGEEEEVIPSKEDEETEATSSGTKTSDLGEYEEEA